MPPGIQQSSQVQTGGGIQTATTGATVIPLNLNRRTWTIQNCGMNPLLVFEGAGANTTTNVSYVLKAGTANDDGTAGSVSSGTVVFTGPISVAGTSPRFVVNEK